MVLLTSCDMIMSRNVLHQHTNNGLEITYSKFSGDYRDITIRLSATKDFGDINVADTSKVDVKIWDTYCHVIPMVKVAQPKLKQIQYIAPDEVKNTGLNLLVLVDLSQPSPVMKKQMEYVKKIYSLFSHDNLYLAFMLPDGKVTPLMVATDYIVNNYININSPLLGEKSRNFVDLSEDITDTLGAMPHKRHAWLYRSVSTMLYNISGHSGTVFDDSRLTSLIIFSDGQVYDEADNIPLDPQHFIIQERLINQSANLPQNVSVYYVNLADAKVNNSVKDSNMMRMLCMRSNGKYMQQFNWISLRDDILDGFNISTDDYLMKLSISEGKIFFGNMRNLQIRIYKKGTKELLAECNSEYMLGNVTKPVIVGNKSYIPIYFAGLLIALLVGVFIYVILQFILPYFRYRIFRKKYVVHYTGQNMSVQGRLVADTCYFCKAPFRVGDSIVAKCQHTMHEECWDENDQHCPEHGRHCPEGSHFYDQYNIFNPRNGSYLTKWIILSIAVAALSWLEMVSSYHKSVFEIISSICDFMKTSKPDIVVLENDIEDVTGIMSISPRMYLLPLFGLYFAPLLTIVFSSLATYHRKWQYRILDSLSRAVVVLVLSVLIFFTEFLTVLVCDVYDGSFFFDWLPWVAVTYLIFYASTVNTRIHDMNSRTALFVSFAMGIVNSFLWNILGTCETKKQITLFILFFIVYGIVLAVTIARKLPSNEKYFLHVSGEIKEMDIALYKWLRQTPSAFVTIGRSVDCQLQVSWDASSDIAPVHAVIRQRNGVPYLAPLNGDVLIGTNLLEYGEEVRLHHGMTFQIGTTVFTFVEA